MPEYPLEAPLERFIPPAAGDDVVIWRYMDFTKYVALLDTQALFFSRVSELDDPFEGSFPATQPPLQRILEMLPPGAVPPGSVIHMSPGLENTWEWIRQWALVSCWHASPHESAAMWRLYASSDLAVAVRSNVGRLRRALGTPPPAQPGFMGKDEYFVGMIEYIDFETGLIPAGSFASQFFRKHNSFEHERELRVLRLEYPMKEGTADRELKPSDPGRCFPVDLATLVEAAFVAPQAPSWYASLVESVTARYGLAVTPTQSRLGAAPLY
jgi:hypothetical protein